MYWILSGKKKKKKKSKEGLSMLGEEFSKVKLLISNFTLFPFLAILF